MDIKTLNLYIKFIFRFDRKILYLLSLLTSLFSQSNLNPNPTKTFINEYKLTEINDNRLLFSTPFKITFNQYLYYNSNLSNLENQNGLYLPKGIGSITGIIFQYYGKHLTLTVEPRISRKIEYENNIPEKENLFSVLNDVPVDDIFESNNNFRNLGIQFHYKDLSMGYSNWDQWWGPGIHNSLVMTNNAQSFYYYYFGTNKDILISPNLKYNFKYVVSNPMKNYDGINYFLSSWFLKLKYKNIEFGSSRNIISGGSENIRWNIDDAFMLHMTNKKIKYWDQIYDYYVLYSIPNSGLKIFIELGLPNRTSNGKNNKVYSGNSLGSNIGLRKYGAFGKNNIMIGFEYTRLVQGIYYNILPTPNWYDNKKFNYYSNNGRRWAAHSGSDSDDLLLFFGYINDKISIIYGINYERHGVTYHYPPEVKIESRLSTSYRINNTFISLNYENEYFEHYGFVDKSKNVWSETFERGSIQKTHTLLFSIEKQISF